MAMPALSALFHLARPPLTPLLTAVALGIALIGLSGPSLVSWYAAWALYAVLQCWAGNMIWASAVVSRFDRNRGLALSLMLMVQALWELVDVEKHGPQHVKWGRLPILSALV